MSEREIYQLKVVIGLLLVGVIFCAPLLGVATDEYIELKNDYKQYLDTQGVIIHASYGAYKCFEQTACQKCVDASQYDSCETMLTNGITGYCNQNVTECCSESCFNCKSGICHQCGRKSPECIENCYCNNINDSPQCSIVSGNCYQPTLTVNFQTNIGNRINVSITKNCGRDDTLCSKIIDNCLIQPQGTKCNDYPIKIEQIKIGDVVGIIYDPNDPTKLMIGKRGEFDVPERINTMFGIGGYFAITVVMLIIGLIMHIQDLYKKRHAQKKEQKAVVKRKREEETEKIREFKRVKKELNENTKGWFYRLLERLFSKRGPPPPYVIPIAPPLTGPQLESNTNINRLDYTVDEPQLPRYTDNTRPISKAGSKYSKQDYIGSSVV